MSAQSGKLNNATDEASPSEAHGELAKPNDLTERGIDVDLLFLVDRMRLEMAAKIESRKWGLKTYKRCFLHEDGMEWLSNYIKRTQIKGTKNTAIDPQLLQEKAAQLGNLFVDARYILHVKEAHRFKPKRKETLFFRFQDKVIDADLQLSALSKELKDTSTAPGESSSVTSQPTGIDKFIMERRVFTTYPRQAANPETSGIDKLRKELITTQTNISLLSEVCLATTNAVVEARTNIATLEAVILCIVAFQLSSWSYGGESHGISLTHLPVMLILMAIIFFWTKDRIQQMVHQSKRQISLLERLSTPSFFGEIPVAEGFNESDDDTSVSVLSANAPITRRIGRAARQTSQIFLGGARSVKYGSIVVTDDQKLILPRPETLPPVSEWPHNPVMVSVNTVVSPKIDVPDYKSGPLPIGKAFNFESELFVGRCLLRFKDIPVDDEEGVSAYFNGRQRRFQAIVQGRFKRELNVDDVLTGHEFDKPFNYLPPSWILSAGTSLIKRLAPGVVIDLKSNQPTFLACLAATSQSVSGDMPGNEPDIYGMDIEEDCSVFGGPFSKKSIPANLRKNMLSIPETAKQFRYDTETVYTFDFFQHLLDVSTYSLDIGITKLGVTSSLNGQPIQVMAKTRQGEYLWSFCIWHETLLEFEDSSR